MTIFKADSFSHIERIMDKYYIRKLGKIATDDTLVIEKMVDLQSEYIYLATDFCYDFNGFITFIMGSDKIEKERIVRITEIETGRQENVLKEVFLAWDYKLKRYIVVPIDNNKEGADFYVRK